MISIFTFPQVFSCCVIFFWRESPKPEPAWGRARWSAGTGLLRYGPPQALVLLSHPSEKYQSVSWDDDSRSMEKENIFQTTKPVWWCFVVRFLGDKNDRVDIGGENVGFLAVKAKFSYLCAGIFTLAGKLWQASSNFGRTLRCLAFFFPEGWIITSQTTLETPEDNNFQ